MAGYLSLVGWVRVVLPICGWPHDQGSRHRRVEGDAGAPDGHDNPATGRASNDADIGTDDDSLVSQSAHGGLGTAVENAAGCHHRGRSGGEIRQTLLHIFTVAPRT